MFHVCGEWGEFPGVELRNSRHGCDYCDDSCERGSHSDTCDVGGIRTGLLTSRGLEKVALTAFRYTGAWHKRCTEETRGNPANRFVDLTSFVHSFIHSYIHRSFIHSFTQSFIHSLTQSLAHSLVYSFIHSLVHSFSLHSFTHSFIH
jgi:hypothetical protein